MNHKKTPERVGIWHKEEHMWTHMATINTSSGGSLHIAHAQTTHMLQALLVKAVLPGHA